MSGAAAGDLGLRAPAVPAPSRLGEVSEGAVEAPSDEDDMGDGAREVVELARKAG